jgi:hypothetical protein
LEGVLGVELVVGSEAVAVGCGGEQGEDAVGVNEGVGTRSGVLI